MRVCLARTAVSVTATARPSRVRVALDSLGLAVKLVSRKQRVLVLLMFQVPLGVKRNRLVWRMMRSVIGYNRRAGIVELVELRTRDRKVSSSSSCRSGGIMFFSTVNFVC